MSETENIAGVVVVSGSKPRHAPQHRGTAEAFLAKKVNDGLIQRFPKMLVVFADMNPHQGAIPFESLALHKVSFERPGNVPPQPYAACNHASGWRLMYIIN